MMFGWLGSDYACTPLNIVVGPKTAKKPRTAFGMETVSDALTNSPKRYVAQGKSLDVSFSDIGDTITTVVEMHSIAPAPTFADWRKPLKIYVSDGMRILPAVIFGTEWLRNMLHLGVRLFIVDMLSEFRNGLQLKNVDCMVLKADGSVGAATGKLATLTKTAKGTAEMQRLLTRPYLPTYRGRKGIAGIHLVLYMQHILEWLPLQPDSLLVTPEGLTDFDSALRGAHFSPIAGPDIALARLEYDEALELQLAVGTRKRTQTSLTTPACTEVIRGLRDELRRGLPFSLTDGQVAVTAGIAHDMVRPNPVNHLLAGEVGSGKTVVALLGMLQAVDASRQCTMLVPTEVLAQQYYRSLTVMPEQAGIAVTVRLLTGSMSTKERRATLLEAINGETDIVVGTYALLSEGVEFFDLGLMVVNEQHRSGVRQRGQLHSRGRGGMTPRLLVIPATPIPRTVATTTFDDLAVSQLTELPRGRQEIRSFVVPTLERPRWEARTWERVAEEVTKGSRVFVICPRITRDGEQFLDESMGAVFDRARKKLPGVCISQLHGNMAPEDKDHVMQAFATGQLDMLVSTTVAEVGVDMPEAMIMMIRRAKSCGIS